MADASVASLNKKQRALVAESAPARLRELDEDQLVELHKRVRRARDKHVKNYRRETAKRIEDVGARGTVSVPPRRSRSKAEIFEEALARVSTSLAAAARRSAATLRAERLAAATAPTSPRPAAAPAGADTLPTATRAAPRRPIERKQTASTRAAGARRQAARDAR